VAIAGGKGELMLDVRRRKFIALLGAAAAWPLVARAQQPAMPVIGFLSLNTPESAAGFLAALRRGLNEFGYVEGQNVRIEYRWGRGQFDRMPALAAELVDLRVNVIVAGGGASAVKAATETIPIVAISGGDLVKSGLVSSLNRPGGNLTAVDIFTWTLGPKRFELLRELIPRTKKIALLVNPKQPSAEAASDRDAVVAAARDVGQELYIANVSTERDFEPAFAAMSQEGVGGLLEMADPFFNGQRERIIALAAHYAIPAIYEFREFTVAGGLMSYGSSLSDAYRQIGIYTGKVLKGAKPGDLPVMRPVKVELIINLKTAKMLGLTFPITLLGRVDEAIE
jgi:putative ABC transport system substrate-binding protein